MELMLCHFGSRRWLMPAKKRPGRPPRGNKAATERIEIRVTRLERAAWEHAAALTGETLSEWIRRRCHVNVETVSILRGAEGWDP